MDPATATAGAYGIETAIEAGVAAYYLGQPTLPLKAQLQHIASPNLIPRSSHSLAVVGDRAYIFEGHLQDRKSSTNDIEELQISTADSDNITTSLKTITAIGENGNVPQTRIHHTAIVARSCIFIFGGCDISSSQALSENGRIWVFDPFQSNWLFLDSPPHTSFPAARYQHSSTANEDGSAIFIHGGITSDDSRLLDT
jgi:N-acetylneuraminic acid mutarotase